ncbi:MAG: hypothetical protein J6I84_05015 [Bacilli bacterium]|nr:hypothetical protein [Bacilli bacterium]
MSLKSVKISEATQLKQVDVCSSSAVLIPVCQVTPDGPIEEPRSLSVETLEEILLQKVETSGDVVLVRYLEDNYYNKEEIDAGFVETDRLIKVNKTNIEKLTEVVDKIQGDENTEGSIRNQILQAKEELIGPEGDQSSNNTINAAKSLVAESLQFIKYS